MSSFDFTSSIPNISGRLENVPHELNETETVTKTFFNTKLSSRFLKQTLTNDLQEPNIITKISQHICDYSASHEVYQKSILKHNNLNLNITNEERTIYHTKKVHPNKIRKCYFCEYTTLYKSSLDRHIDGIHLNLRNHKCQICDFSSTRKYDLKRHVDNVHLNLRKHKCPLCEFSSNRKYGLKKHMEKIHLCSLYHAKVQQCNSVSSNNQKENIRINGGSIQNTTVEYSVNNSDIPSKCYGCHLCEYVSNKASNVERHIFLIHSKKKTERKLTKSLHECTFCDFNTKEKASLRKHINGVHLNLRNHKCHLCEYTSNQSGTLKNHINAVHFNLRKYKCNFCPYGSNHKNVLVGHLEREHTKLYRNFAI